MFTVQEEPELEAEPVLRLSTEEGRARERLKTRSPATLMVVKKTVSGVPGAAGRAVTEAVEEEQNTELATALRQGMEADSVWDLGKRAGAATTRPVKKKRKKVFWTAWRVSSPWELRVDRK